MEEETQHS